MKGDFMHDFVPKFMFFTKGVGYHRDKLQSFEYALRNSGVEACNLVSVSSIFPPECKILPKSQGIKKLKPGQITFVVIARESTNEPNRLVFASVGLATTKAKLQYGYLSEYHGFGKTLKAAGDYAEDLAATMLASTMGLELDAEKAWDERKQVYKVSSEHQFVTRSIAQSAEGQKDGLWTTVVAMAVMLLE
jgi:arginine decarboxylase